MTDVLARPAAAEPETAPRPEPDKVEAPRDGPDAEPTPMRWFLAALLLGAGAIHLAMAPSHLGESTVEGAGFLAAAWAQVALAGVVALRPTRRAYAAVAATSVVLIGVWTVSRTAGLPFGAHSGHAESVSLVDATCVALEGLALVLAAALLTGTGVATTLARAHRVAIAGAFAAMVVATGAIASPSARDHASASHGDHGSGTAAGHADAGDGPDSHAHGGATEAAGDDKGFSELSNGHQHEHATDEPLTAEERVLLARQVAATAELVERYPTLGDAEAAGWIRAGPFSPGLGVHYGAPRDTDRSASFDPIDPENMPTPMLVYDGLEPDAPLAGFMYSANGTDTAPEGFAGPNDNWHYHEAVCIKFEDGVLNTPFGADLEGVTEEMCTGIGGQWIETTGYMVHVWSVPGYESPDGMFTELNPRITCPDGTYYRIDIREVGNRDTVCRNA